jgi:hypothetical protein
VLRFISAAPQVAEFLDTPQLSKKGDKKGKKKDQGLLSAVDGMVGVDSAGTGTPDPLSGGIISVPPTGLAAGSGTNLGSGPASPAPMMKASFARIGDSAEPGSGIPTPTGTNERTKLSIGLKRKAVNSEGGPPNKRR